MKESDAQGMFCFSRNEWCNGSSCMAWKSISRIAKGNRITCPECHGEKCNECYPEFSGFSWTQFENTGFCRLIGA